MNLILFREYAAALCFATKLFIVLFLFSCNKNINDAVDPGNTPPDLVTKVTSSVSGFVTDQNNIAVVGAMVKAGGSNTTTDKYGYFEFKNIQVVKEAATVEVSYAGYFKGIKTYMATEDKAAFFRIKLLQKTITGSINATSGGVVSLSNGLNISLPVNAIKNAATGSAYTGTVNVAAQFIDPTSNEVNSIMPGDLRGINAGGYIKALTSYGMMAVELTGASGELLQVADGKKATVTFPVPASINNSAPATIPLWYFDESNGLWKEEGTATKTGNTYVGEVSHFSFWNCDVPNNYIQFDCTVHDQYGHPLAAWVKITETGTPNSACGWTDLTGYVAGAVPDNANLLLEVFVSYNCGTAVYSQHFSTGSTAMSLGTITVTTSSVVANITGTATNCSNAVLSGGRIIVQEGYWFTTYNINNDGTFSFSRLICNGSANINIIAEDMAASQQSTPLQFTLAAGTNNVGNLQACGINTQQFITYSIDGGPATTLSSPADSLINTANGPNASCIMYGYQNNSPTSIIYVNFSFENLGMGVGTVQQLNNFYASQIGQGSVSSSPGVTITEYGDVGQFIAGSFTAVLNTNTNPPPVTHTVSCSFRIRRGF